MPSTVPIKLGSFFKVSVVFYGIYQEYLPTVYSGGLSAVIIYGTITSTFFKNSYPEF
jgi:hypothetical protein